MVGNEMGTKLHPCKLCARALTTWKRKACAGFLLMVCLMLSMFTLMLPSHHHGRDTKKHRHGDTDRHTSSWFFSNKLRLQVVNPQQYLYHSGNKRMQNATTRSTASSNFATVKAEATKPGSRRIPCSNLTIQSPKGPVAADTVSFPGLQDLESMLSPSLQLGGHYVPQNCRPTKRIAIIVPFRDRSVHLKLFLRHMHPFLQRQNVEYYIVIVEQADGEPFNRALLFNIGYTKMNKLHDIDCFIFHDVDLLPLDDRILYLCHDQPLHLSMIVDTLGKNLMYRNLFGGVVAMTPEMLEAVNGFPNTYYGWGGEDDDMSYRIRHHGYSIDRYSKEISRYTMIRHGKEDDVNQAKINKKVEQGRLAMEADGLNNLSFHLLEFQPLPLYTWMLIRPNLTSSTRKHVMTGMVDTTDVIVDE